LGLNIFSREQIVESRKAEEEKEREKCLLSYFIPHNEMVAKYDSPDLVFAGAVLALGFISLLGILAGKKLCEIMPLSKIRLGAGILFILFGILFLAGF
jgi:hypothetical protein